jgi:hypothetical protein
MDGMSPLVGLRFSDRRGHGEEESGSKTRRVNDQEGSGTILLFVVDCCVREGRKTDTEANKANTTTCFVLLCFAFASLMLTRVVDTFCLLSRRQGRYIRCSESLWF